MSRTTARAAVAAVLTVLLLPLAATAGVARATATPDLNLRTLPGPGNPLQVDRLVRDDPPPSPGDCIAASGNAYDDDCYDVALAVSATEDLAEATVTVVERKGLYVDPLVTALGPMQADTTELVRFAVRARTTGLHTLTLEVTAPGAEPRRVSLPYVWRAGGEPIAGDGSLAGRLYGNDVLGSYPCTPAAECTFRDSDRVAFLDATRTSPALALDGKAVCGPDGRCPAYHYDEATGLVQVGRDTIGRITKRAAFIGGERYVRMVYPRPGQRLDGLWQYGANVDEGRGAFEQRLRLRDSGRFRLRYAVDTTRYTAYGEPERGATYSRALKGIYRIGRDGRVALADPRRGTTVATLAVVASPRGRPRPASKGLWLDLPAKKPTGPSFVDGNRLFPLPPSVPTRTPAAALRLSTQPGPAVPFRVERFTKAEAPPAPEACVAEGGDPRGDDCQDVVLTIAGTAPLQDVTVSVVESDGLYVDPMVTTVVDSGEDTSRTVGFAVRGRTSGLHTLVLEVTAPGSEPRTITLPYVWRAGGTPLPGDDSLAGRTYGDNGTATSRCGTETCTYRYAERLSFLTDTEVSRSLARRGKPTCGPSGTCPRYHYDSETGLVQVGRFIIGRVTETTASFSGERFVPLAYPQRGERLDGAWGFTTSADEARGIGEEYLRLRPDGRFRLVYTFTTADSTGVRKQLGTYRIGHNGRLRLNDNKHKETLIATMAVVTSPGGTPLASSRGIWLDLEVRPSPPARRFVDGNRMFPVP